MKINILYIAVLISFILFSCDKHVKEHNLSENHDGEHWSYEGKTGPAHWAELEEESVCDGLHQSPINIITKDVIKSLTLETMEINYTPSTKIHDVINNGHTIQYNFEEGDFIMYKGEKFNLKQIHFHEPAEHTINGIRYPAEMHMVHSNQYNQLSVIAIMAQEGEASAPFDFLEKYLPVNPNETKTIDTSFDLNLNLPEDKNYYNYTGSLTTPPCTEGVNWFVFNSPITISVEQVKKLQELMPINNYRPENPLNGRVVKTI
jgi:carbonic anhydrase